MKLAYLSPSRGISINQSGGAGTHIRGTLQGFKENGVEVLPLIAGDMFASRIDNGNKEEIKIIGNKKSFRNLVKGILPNKIRLFFRDLRTIKEDKEYIKKAAIEIEKFKPEAIYERSSFMSVAGIQLASQFNLPLFFETDGCMVEIIRDDYGVFSTQWGNSIERRKMLKADFVVVMNKLAINVVSEKFRISKNKFIVKTLGIEAPDTVVDENKIKELKSKFSLEGKYVVGFVGSISTYHGVNLLIDAGKHLKNAGRNDIALLIVGWSKEAESLKAQADAQQLNNIIFAGRVDKSEVPSYYSLMDAAVIPNAEESIYPIKVLEYGIFKLCPLVPKYEVFDEIIREGVTGFYFHPRKPESMAEKIMHMAENPFVVSGCANTWHAIVKDNFKWKHTVKEVVEKMRLIVKKEN